MTTETNTEPVLYQYRMRPEWIVDGWHPWQECSKETAESYNPRRRYGNWEYESRALYLQPVPPKLSTAQIDEIESDILQQGGDHRDVYRALIGERAVPFSIEVAQTGLLELYAFQEATGCDTAEQFLTQKFKIEGEKL